jgi:hypothetical protein
MWKLKGGIGGTLVLLKKKLDLVINENSLNQNTLKAIKVQNSWGWWPMPW